MQIYNYLKENADKSQVPYPEWLSDDADAPDRILWSVLVMLDGDYGVSPRYGWIEKPKSAIERMAWFVADVKEGGDQDDYEHATLVDIKEPLKVMVVRCKDCRHRDLFSCPLADNDYQKDDDYCSWGERREHGQDRAKAQTHGVCSDLISRQAAVEKILRNKDAKPLNESDYQDGIRAGLDIAYCEIRDMPSAEPVHGEWVEKDGELVCSVCGNSISFSRTPKGWALGKFCQTCGAKMDKEENNE